MEGMRKTLNMLLGPNRNGDRKETGIKDFMDKNLCKFDLCGLCPYQLFPNTKMDLGPCPYEMCPVEEKYRNDFEKKRGRSRKLDFEVDWENLLYTLVRKCDERVQIKQKRIELQSTSQVNEPEQLKKLKSEIDTHTKEIERLGEEGKLEEAQDMIKKMGILKKEIELLEGRLPKTKENKLVVCEVCAALLSEEESDQRLADHFAGKGHIGYQKIREKVKEIKEQKRKQRDRDYYDDRDRYGDRNDYRRKEDYRKRDDYRRDDRRDSYQREDKYSSRDKYYRDDRRNDRYSSRSGGHGGSRYSSSSGSRKRRREGGRERDRYERSPKRTRYD